MAEVYKLVKDLVDEHKATYDENHMRDFIDVYLREIQASKDPDFNGNSAHELN